MDFSLEKFAICLRSATWMVKLRWNCFLLLITFWSLLSGTAISDCKPGNRKFLVPVLLLLLLIICAMFIYFSHKISMDDVATVKGPTLIPAGVYAEVILPVTFLTVQILVFYSGSRTIAALYLSLLFVFNASFFKIAVSLDPKNMATSITVGTSVGLCIVMVAIHRVIMALVPAALSVVVGLGLFCIEHMIYKQLEKDGEAPGSYDVEAPQITRAEVPPRPRVEAPPRPRAEAPPRPRAEAPQRTQAEAPQRTQAEAPQRTKAEAPQRTRVEVQQVEVKVEGEASE